MDTEPIQSKFGSCLKFFFSALILSPAQLLLEIFLFRTRDRALDSFFLPPLFPALGHLAIYGASAPACFPASAASSRFH
jgi:hypothetical protein